MGKELIDRFHAAGLSSPAIAEESRMSSVLFGYNVDYPAIAEELSRLGVDRIILPTDLNDIFAAEEAAFCAALCGKIFLK